MVGGSAMTESGGRTVIDVATEFSPYPSGRFPTDGQYNGELFRTRWLVPALRRASTGDSNVVVVDIDGVRSFGSSFLEEAFAGLIRLRLFDKRFVQKHLSIRCTKPHLQFFKQNIEELIAKATPTSSTPI